VIATHLRHLGLLPENGKADTAKDAVERLPDGEGATARLAFCPACNQPGLVAQENCVTCLSCGYSKCG